MASEVSELLVKVRPDGIEDTKSGLQDVDEQFDSTADETERTAGIIGDMSERLGGFVGIIVGTLATFAAGLLAQVPVIQETASALGAVVDAVALKVDDVLRPVVGDLNEQIFRFADAITREDFSEMREAFGEITIMLGKFPTFLTPIQVAVGLFLTNWDEAWAAAQDIVGDFVGGVKSFINDVTSFITTGISDFIDTVSLQWDVFWSQVENRAKQAGNTVLSTVESFVNKAIRGLNRLPKFNFGEVSFGRFETRTQRQIVEGARQRQQERQEQRQTATGRGGEAQIERVIAALQDSERQTTVEIDGREVATTTEGFLGEGAANAGRTRRTR